MEESLKSATSFPETDPTPIFELFRGSHATEILVAAVCHLKVFDRMADGPLGWTELKEHTGLSERPMVVLLTALQAMGLLEKDDSGNEDSAETLEIAAEQAEGQTRLGLCCEKERRIVY